MLSLFALKSSSEAVKYYSEHDYYSQTGEQTDTSNWHGRGAVELGLSGTVDKAALDKLLQGKIAEQQLGVVRDGKLQHRPGWDLTFSAPKSVSILALVGKDDRLIQAHNKAVHTALNYIEKHYLHTRIYQDEKLIKANTGSSIVAQFQHQVSRELDPQLHTHNLVINATKFDGKYKSIEPKAIYQHTLHGGLIYRNALAKHVTELGYNIEAKDKGLFEIKDLDPAIIKQFSKRREQVLEAAAEHGFTSSEGMDKATLYTRKSKQHASEVELKHSWQQELTPSQEQSISTLIEDTTKQNQPGIITRTIDAIKEAIIKEQPLNPLDAVNYALTKMMHTESVIDASQLHGETTKSFLGRFSSDEISKAINEHPQLVFIGDKVTTLEEIAREKTIIHEMKQGQGIYEPLASKSFLAEHAKYIQEKGLNLGQTRAVNTIASSKDLIVGVQGYAGTGKTYMLETVTKMIDEVSKLTDKPIKQYGFAPTGAAAKQLAETGMQTNTIASLLIELDQPKLSKDLKNNIWIIDESSMVNNHNILTLLNKAKELDTKIVMLGDKQQLGAIEAGKPFANLIKHGMQHSIMDDIQRQKDPILLDAVYDTIAGKPQEAIAKLTKSIQTNPNKDKLSEQIVEQYTRLDEKEQKQTLVVIPDNKTRDKVQQDIREILQRNGRVDSQDHDFQTRKGLVHAPIELTNLNTFKPGMVLEVFGSNPRLNISKDGGSLRVEGRADSKVILRNVVTKEKIQIQPSLLAKMDLRKFALTTEQPKKLAVGDAIIFKRTDKKLNLYNGQKAIVQRIKGNTIYYGKDMLSGQTKLDTNKYKYWDHNYAHTVYSAQGQTFKNCLALMDSEHKQLTTAKSFYVTISRAKSNLTLYTDNQDKLIDSISKQLGEKTSSIDNIKEIRQNTQASEREKTTTALPPEKQITSDTILQR